MVEEDRVTIAVEEDRVTIVGVEGAISEVAAVKIPGTSNVSRSRHRRG